MRGKLSIAQREILCRPINPRRVLHRDGHSHVAAHDVIAHLTRIFGFEGWDKEILRLDVIDETLGHPTNREKKGWYVTYRCELRLTIRDPNGLVVKVIDEVATGTAQNQPQKADAHDMASKNAVSYAIKRCAKDLGDQFGLSLYDKGSTDRLIARSVAYGEAQDDKDVPTVQSMGNDERPEDGE